ncbi:hypothetical protein CA236_01210 [Sphingomonas sp. ABOLG]|uniref:hypothetical protein n=1 Tax=Sphingomonas sp. ABOLG TaxID=1985880 RepID=UPI000F7DB82B|nr:hypothetical protein [Sphingomonas sp. ABOLG]RSV20543.1 hypothetical protein CA236_01210 [Sphingomonas sp. ABOLG]
MKIITDTGTIELGTTETTPRIGIVDYSKRVTDDFGVTTVVERGFSQRLSVRMALPFGDVDALQRRLADLRATPVRWVADDRFSWLSADGYYKDFELDLAVPPISYCTLTVEGLAGNEIVPDAGGDPAPEGEASTFQLLQPVPVTDAVLVDSSVPEDPAPAWSADITYPAGAIVARAHRRFESLVANNKGNDPATNGPGWLDIGPTNRWAMFDDALGTETSAAGAIVVQLNAGAATGLALLDVRAATVRVQAPGYDRTQQVGAGAITFLDLPGVAGTIAVTIAGAGNVGVGTLLVGQIVGLGITEAAPSAGITDFSRKEVDDFGEVTVVQRAWAKRMSARALIRTEAVDQVANRIAAVRARPSLWIGQTGIDCLTLVGFFKDFSIEVGPTLSKLSLSIEGLSKAAKPKPLGAGVNWEDIADPTGTKPANNADVTGENTAKDTEAVGGVPSTEVIAQLDRIEPIEAQFSPITSDISALQQVQLGHDDALAQLADVTADQGAAQRQITRDVGRMDEALLRALMESARTREVLRDAGIVVDPATGQVRIYAIDQLRDRTSTAEIAIDAVKGVVATKASVNQVQELIARAVLDPSQVAELEPIIARLTSAESEIDGLNAAVALKASLVEVTAIGGRVSTTEQTLDALAGEVSNKASTTIVDQLGIRIGSAEQMLSALPDVSGYSVTVRQARVAADDAAEAALRGMLAGDMASRYQLSQIAEARQELTTKLVDGFTAEAIARTALTVQIGQIRASVLSEAQASVTRDNLLTQQLQAQGGALDNQAAAIGRLDRVSLDNAGGIASAQMTIRQQIGASDSSDEALLRALIAGDEAGRARIAQAVQIQTEFTTTLVENERASAVARQSLLARMNAAEAAIVTTAKVAAEANQATAQRVSALEVAFNDASTGLLATRARIVALEETTAAQNAAFAQQLELIEATVGGQGDGLAAISATVAQDRQARVDGDAANALAVEQVRTQVNDPQTGLPATAAGLEQERTARTQGDAANAQEIQTISAALYDPQTGLPATRAIVASDRQARIDGDSANASAIQQARAIIDGVGGVGVEQAFSAVATRLGKVEGRYTVTIDANGNLSGFQLIGSDAGPASFNLINTDLRMGTGRVIFNNGTYMQVQGVAFGANGDLLEWFGPTMAITSCTRANAISYKTITGDAYFGGSLSAGVLKNAVTSSLTTANASLELGPFGTTGKPKSVVASYSYSLRRRVNPPGGSITGTPSATLVLERRRGADGPWVQLQTGTITGETSYDAPEGNTPGLGTQTMAGAITITDNSEGAQDFSYRLTLVSRTLATFNFSSPNDGPAGEPIQSLSLVSVEQ